MIETETEIFNVFLLVGIALIFARVLGYLFNRIKQPAVLGEIISGIILGWLLVTFSGHYLDIFGVNFGFNFNFQATEYEFFYLFAEIGIIFLLFISGLEISVSRMKKMGKKSTSIAVGGVITPFILGILGGLLLGLSLEISLVIGLILTATSVGVTVRTLMDLHVLDSDVGATILGGAVIDDVIGIILLAFALGIGGTLINFVFVGVRIAVFFLLFLVLLIFKILDRILDASEHIHLPKAFLSISLAILLIYSFIANWVQLSGIIGAFLAGILIGQYIKSRKIEEDIKTIGYGFFIPLFFVWVGMNVWSNTNGEMPPLFETLLIAAVIIVVGIIGKMLGSSIGAKISGMSTIESLQVGVGMIPRMELALIIVAAVATKGIIKGEIAQQLLISTILLTIVTTVIAPVFIKALFKKE